MGFCAGDCLKDSSKCCTAWDGKGAMGQGITLNHNLVKDCPDQCEYAKKKIPTKGWTPKLD